MARYVDGITGRLGALQADVRGERRFSTTVADGLIGALREVRVGLGAPCRREPPASTRRRVRRGSWVAPTRSSA